MTQVLTIVDKLCKKIKADSRFDYINRGGCGVFASLLAHKLQDLGITTNVKLIEHRPHNIDAIRPRLVNPLDMGEWYEQDVYFCHLAVEITTTSRKTLWDGHGEYFLDGSILCDGRFTLPEAKSFAETDRWNKMFDRSLIPALRLMVHSIG